ncbi:formate dehydrogenase subunit gamma [Burkholderia sp. Ac-20365]|jgi:formate dehydrogenase subunit gamma|uniref:formate dehydrogenase subunit gamma n=1 Tax=Burkholderia sp. Ac-20365 TaxID=2703897 RepID=UPI00197C03C8|nr:formate dehydrogenase subunit gamma [Burkholderia sp. Ac-20365]MBN3761582.1 formate dehydrogenase subunit gamma [Burkholderia sp. Ac-20365]
MSEDGKWTHDNLIERYNANERTIHWITAISFVLLALSGLALFHPAMFWLSNLFGGGQWLRILHPFIGLVMFSSFACLALRYWHHNLIEMNDIRWLMHILDILNNREEGVPEVGRYNAGQKMLFWTLLPCMIVLLLSGIAIWRRYFSGYLPIDVVRLGALAHAAAAFVLIAAILVHIYAGIWIQGTLGAMLHGYVTPGWARKHHPRWFRSLLKSRNTH